MCLLVNTDVKSAVDTQPLGCLGSKNMHNIGQHAGTGMVISESIKISDVTLSRSLICSNCVLHTRTYFNKPGPRAGYRTSVIWRSGRCFLSD